MCVRWLAYPLAQVWPPYENEKYETLSYLPPLSEAAILRQVDYLMRNSLTPCIGEFSEAESYPASSHLPESKTESLCV